MLWWLLGTLLLPRIIHSAFIAGKEELLVILSIGLALGLAFLSASWNFSSALGAFIMGSILAECRERRKISDIIDKWQFILAAICTIIFGKFTLNFIFNLFAGRGLKDSVRISGFMVQIGELSFVIAQVGVSLGAIDNENFSAIVAIAIITILITPFIVKLSLLIADKSEFILPKSVCKLIESYSQSVIEFSLENKMLPFYEKYSIIKGIRYLISNTKSRLKKNYMLMTSKNVTATLDRLAPWDEYLVPVAVGSNANISGKNLIDLNLREKFSINIVAIGRESRTIISPTANETIMSNDVLLVYGNEKSVSELEHYCNEEKKEENFTTLDQCILAGIKLNKGHPFIHRSILDLEIRVNYNCIVLAVNRKNNRIKNPISTFIFHVDDELFIFGTRESLEKIKELQK